MPDLGAYVVEVALAYAGSLVLILGLVGLSWWRAVRVRAALARAEKEVR
ncbi:heme exporter protein CcmD [Actibacterium sp. 188UL27-1]|nr:heme exporter protein CcmD [Actibacterium sp. 188UL27-1]